MKFVVAVPRILLSEEIEAESVEDAARGLRDSGAFSQGMTELMRAGTFDDMIGDGSPTLAYVIPPDQKTVVVLRMEVGWRLQPATDIPF